MIAKRSQRIDGAELEGVLLGENPRRTGLVIYNNTNTVLYVEFSAEGATLTSYTYVLPASSTLEYIDVPEAQVYKGKITYRWAAATQGHAMVSEFSRTSR